MQLNNQLYSNIGSLQIPVYIIPTLMSPKNDAFHLDRLEPGDFFGGELGGGGGQAVGFGSHPLAAPVIW